MLRRLLTRGFVALSLLLLLVGLWSCVRREPARPSAAAYRADRLDLLSALPAPAGAVVMVGDSLTDRGEWTELLGIPNVVNRGLAGDQVKDVITRAPSLRGDPYAIVLMIGINDLVSGREPSEVAADYKTLLLALRRASPRARLIVQSVLPVNDNLTREPVRNASIHALNLELRRLAIVHRCEFADIASVVSDSTGSLDARMTRDGVHLSAAGYRAWAAGLRATL